LELEIKCKGIFAIFGKFHFTPKWGTVNTGIKEIKEQYNKRIFYIIYKVKNPFIILFFYFFYSGIYGKMADHFGAILVRFRGEIGKFTNNLEPNLPHDQIKLWGSLIE
jgi:hypothetical protein